MAGGLIASAIIFTQNKPSEIPKPDTLREMKAAVAAKMIDPGSATFRELGEKAPDFMYCGEVNAKNRMGGYVGYQKFFAYKGTAGDWVAVLDPRIIEGMCKELKRAGSN